MPAGSVRRAATLALCLGVGAVEVAAQGYTPYVPGAPNSYGAPNALGTPGSAGGRDLLGDRLRFHAGPFEFSPYIHVGEVAVDTNVFYTPTERHTDLTANGGPGLTIACPIGEVRPWIDGNLNYYWFQKTVQLRHLGGQAGGGFDWLAGGFTLGASSTYLRTYTRPSIEVDARILGETWNHRAYVSFHVGRLRLEPHFEAGHTAVLEPATYLGTDLQRTLTQEMNRVGLDIAYRLTAKTDLVVIGDQQWDRFPQAPTRDADSNRVAAGFQVSSETRLSGRAVGGVRIFRPQSIPRGSSFTKPYVDARIDWLLGEKTRVSVAYTLDINYSAFQTVETALPTAQTQVGRIDIYRRIWRKIEMNLDGSINTLVHNVPVVIVNPDGTTTISRDDHFYTAHADLGYRIFDRLRVGGMVTYNDRQSNYSDFGINGFLVGGSIRFNP